MKLPVPVLLLVFASLSSCRSDGASSDDPAAMLVGIDWTLTALIVEGELVAFGVGEQAPTLRLDSSRRLVQTSGFAGVNRYSGPCNLGDDGHLAFPPLITTRMAGPPERMQLESAYLAQLQNARSYAVAGRELTILSETGSLVFHTD